MLAIKIKFELVGMFVLAALLLIGNVSAVGIKWYTESEYVYEGDEKCILYGAYNPSSNDIKVKIEVSGELASIIQGASTEDKIIAARTPSKNAENINFCFKVPEVYEKDCLIGGFVCAQTCEEEVKNYNGEVTMTEQIISQGGAAIGSGTSIAASTSLALTVKCNKSSRNWTPVIILGIIIVLILIGIVLYRKYRKPKLQRDMERLEKLKKMISREKGEKEIGKEKGRKEVGKKKTGKK